MNDMTTRQLPNKIVICGAPYDVEIVKNLRGEKNQKIDGWIRMGMQKVMIDADLNPFMKWQVMFHEVVHGIVEICNLKHIGEQKVDTIAYGIMSVLTSMEWIEPPLHEALLTAEQYEKWLASGGIGGRDRQNYP